MNNKTNESKVEIATQYIENAKTCQEQLWKRRNVEWKNGFALWTAIALATAFIMKVENTSLPNFEKWRVLFVVLVLVGYIAVVIVHKIHLKAIFISNEKDLEFLNYYRNRAAWELCDVDFESKPERPSFEGMSDEKYYEKHEKKMKHHLTPIAISVLIAFLSWCLLALKFI